MNVAAAWAMLEVAVLMQSKLLPMIWQGNPANNVGTGYAEFPGLDILISTNKRDAHTNALCQALNSDVKDFNFQAITATDAAGNFRIVRMLCALERYVRNNAVRMNLMPASWAFAMKPEAWAELSEIWPIAYLTTRNVSMPTGNTMYLDATRINQMRDDMRAGEYIFINGRQYPVYVDDGIYEYDSTNNANVPAGSFASNIYMVPLTYLGSRPATFIQHKDYRAASAEIAVGNLQSEYWTDDGRFLWTTERAKWCWTLSGKVEPRIVLKTPQIAGRVDHVLYTPEQHLRSPWQDSDYFEKGGTATRAEPDLYSDWNQS
jgi:hypothetical protein